MSFIRAGQEGTYVEIPGGSNYYLYDNGNDIEGWSYGEFAALIGGVADELPDAAFSDQSREEVKSAFEEYFGGWDEEYRGGITPPERGEIFCQCVNSRIEDTELTEDLHRHVREWADEFEVMRKCDYCGEEFRPVLYTEKTPWVCPADDCGIAFDAEMYGTSFEDTRRADVIMYEVGHDEGWEYLVANSDSLGE